MQRRMRLVVVEVQAGEGRLGGGRGGKQASWHRAKGRSGPRYAWCRHGGMQWARSVMLMDMLSNGQRVGQWRKALRWSHCMLPCPAHPSVFTLLGVCSPCQPRRTGCCSA